MSSPSKRSTPPLVAPHNSVALRAIASEDRLHFGRRAAYRRQDLAGRRLMFQRLRQVSRLRLHLVEQPRVLNGDDRLIRESLEQLDLTFREGHRFGAAKSDHSDGLALAHQRHYKVGPPKHLSRSGGHAARSQGRRDWIFVGMFRDVVDVYRPAFNDGSAGSPPATDLLRSECDRNGSVVGHNSQLIALAQQHHGVIGAAQAAGRLHDIVQHRLEIVGRGSDDSKNIAGRGLLPQRFLQSLF